MTLVKTISYPDGRVEEIPYTEEEVAAYEAERAYWADQTIKEQQALEQKIKDRENARAKLLKLGLTQAEVDALA